MCGGQNRIDATRTPPRYGKRFCPPYRAHQSQRLPILLLRLPAVEHVLGGLERVVGLREAHIGRALQDGLDDLVAGGAAVERAARVQRDLVGQIGRRRRRRSRSARAIFKSRCGRSQTVPKQYSWMARAWVGQIALSSSQLLKPSLPKASSRIFLPRAARSSLIWLSCVAVRVGELVQRTCPGKTRKAGRSTPPGYWRTSPPPPICRLRP